MNRYPGTIYDKLAKKKAEEIKKKFQKFLNYIFMFFGILLKSIIVGALGWGVTDVIYTINSPTFGYNYAMFASHAVAGLLWALLPDFWRKEKK